MGRRHLDLDPPTLNPIIEQEPDQVRHPNVPLGGAGSDEKNEEVLFLQFDVPNDQRQFHASEKKDHAQNGPGKNLKKKGYRIA